MFANPIFEAIILCMYRSTHKRTFDIVFLHGFGTNSVTWLNIDSAIKERHRCHFINLTGYGNQPPPNDFDFRVDSWACQLAQYLKSNKFEDPVIVAHSMGCAVALSALLKEKFSIKFSVFVNPLAYNQALPSYLQILRNKKFASILTRIIPPRMQILYAFQDIHYDPSRVSEHLVKAYEGLYKIKHFRSSLIDTVAAFERDSMEGTARQFRDLNGNFHLIYGENDKVIDQSSFARIVTDVEFQTIHKIPFCGHAPHEESPRQFNSILLEILDSEAR